MSGSSGEMVGDFGSRLAGMVAKEMAAARGDRDRAAEVIERLLNSTGLSIAIACGGDSEMMSTMLMGAETYLNEAAGQHARLAAFMTSVRRR